MFSEMKRNKYTLFPLYGSKNKHENEVNTHNDDISSRNKTIMFLNYKLNPQFKRDKFKPDKSMD